jgi:FLVCR family MFS transporter 7
MGAALLIAGIVAALVSAPLFDRIFTTHIAATIRVLCPTIGAAWLSLIWAGGPLFIRFLAKAQADSNRIVRPNNAVALYVLLALIGACSVSLLPIALELACELTRNADGSSAALWFLCVLPFVPFIAL